uniref:hypothetical protein n=1 Tax=Gracilaria cornea TaxID=356490 RepID=UPI001D113F79|nr:hypothetical protein LK099_pgp027 [Crassiphycus corneus]UAD84859.1 hypothetical protein [Crassiphycus corneus]
MYFYQKFHLDSNNYHFFSFQLNYILILSSFSYKIIDQDCVYWYSINNYTSSIFSKHLLKILVFIMMLYTSNLVLEVKIENFRALSLYYWLGFSVVHIRFYYYILSISISSAYSLVNTKSMSQNIFRRYLVLNLY